MAVLIEHGRRCYKCGRDAGRESMSVINGNYYCQSCVHPYYPSRDFHRTSANQFDKQGHISDVNPTQRGHGKEAR